MNTLAVWCALVAFVWLAIIQERNERKQIREDIKRRIRQ